MSVMRYGAAAAMELFLREVLIRTSGSCLACALTLLALTPLAQATEPVAHTIGVVSIRGPEQTLAEWQPTADYLSGTIPGHSFRILPVTLDTVEGVVARRQVEFILTNPASYAVLQTRQGVTRIATLVRREGNLALKEFGGLIFTRADHKDIRTLADLRGRTIVASNPTAYGSYMMQAFELLSAGIDPESDIKRLFVGLPQDNIVQAVVDERADAGFVRDGLLEHLAAEGKIRLSDFKGIGLRNLPGHPYMVSTILYPEWPIAALPGVDETLANRVVVALLSMPKGSEAARRGQYAGWSIPLNYTPVDALMRAMRAPPYDAPEAFHFSDILHKYYFYIYPGLIAILLALLVAITRFRNLNRHLSGQMTLVAERSSSLEAEVKSRLHAEARLADENQILDQLSHGTPLPMILETLLRMCETEYPEAPAAILIFDAEHEHYQLAASKNLGDHRRRDLVSAGIPANDRKISGSNLTRAFKLDTAAAAVMEPVPGSSGEPIAQLVIVLSAARQATMDRLFLTNLARVAGMAIERARLADSLRLSASVFSNALEGIMVTDAEGRIVDVNPSFVRLTGYTVEEVLGRMPSVLKSDRHDEDFYRDMWVQLQRQGHWSGEVWNRRKSGQVFAEILQISGVRDAKGRLTHYVSTFSDITTLKETQSRLEKLASYDPLTGLPNRTLLADRLTQAMSQAKRRDRLLAVCFMDLDGFKPVNDTLGHDFGDMVLQEVAQRLAATMRAGDTVARLGGDEFVLLVGDLIDVNELETGIRRVLDGIAAPISISGRTIKLTTSIGVTLFPIDDEDPDTLLRHADNAMYRAKQEGRNRFHMFDTDDATISEERAQRRERLFQAITNGELRLHYQPKVSLRGERVTGVEALLRWQHPDHGLLPPGTFLPEAEHDEIICDIGRWVLREALRQQEEWKARGLHLPVSVNIAARHLLATDFRHSLQTLLDEFPDRVPGGLELEILESAAIEDTARMTELIERCHELGVRFALDDFGTGYSSLTHLQHLPADTIKIDRTFVNNMLSSRSGLAIIEAIMGLANAFRCEVVAEGIETLDQGTLLARLGCDTAQGYAIAKPMPGEEISLWIANYRQKCEWLEWSEINIGSEDFPLIIAEVEHHCWTNDLISAIDGKPLLTPVDSIRHSERCEFGKWLEQTGRQRFGHSPLMTDVDKAHNAVHAVGRRMLGLVEGGDFEAARNLAPELRTESDRLVAAMRSLQRHEANRQPA